MKKILILTVTAGNGHNSCARVMKNKLESMGDVEVKVVDLLKCYSNKLNFWVADGGYNIAVSKLLPLYNAFYEHYKKASPEKRYSCASQNTVVSTLSGLLKEILEFQPDVIYSTHFYGAIALTNLKFLYALPCKTIVSSLDYVNSPFWEAGIGVDYFVIPNEDFIEECVVEGFSRTQLLTFGIPVDERTLTSIDKKEARQKLGLDLDTLTIMVMFGGGHWNGGYKIFSELIKALKGRKVQVIMINGRNQETFEKIEKTKFEANIKVVNVGFTNNIPLYLAASDLILSKAGGLSVTEMINSGVPMLITENVPAQEKYNLEYLKKRGVALSFKNNKELKVTLNYLLENSQIMQEMSEKTKELKKNGANDLAQFIINLPRADYSEFLRKQVDLSKVKKQVKKELRVADKYERKKYKLKRQGEKV